MLDHNGGGRERVSLVCVLPLQNVSDSFELQSIITADSQGALHVSEGNFFSCDSKLFLWLGMELGCS